MITLFRARRASGATDLSGVVATITVEGRATPTDDIPLNFERMFHAVLGTTMKTSTSALTALLLTSSAAFAQEAGIFTLDEIIFSAGLAEIEEDRTGVSVETITEDELEDTSVVQLTDALESLPGVNITQNGPLGTNAALRIRGLNGNYIPVLINGIDVTDTSSTQTSFNFGPLSTMGLGRVEVLYGSQSAIYGSEAIAGVISISTLAAPEENGTEFRYALEAGSYDTQRGMIGVATRFDRGELSFNLNRVTTDGFSAADENAGNSEADGFDSTAFNFAGAYDLTDTVRVGGSLIWQDSYVNYDNGFPISDSLTNFTTTDLRGARIFAQIDGANIDHEVSAQYSETLRRFPNSARNVFQGTRTGFAYLGQTDLGATQALSFGAEHVSETYFSSTATTPLNADYWIGSVFAEYTNSLTSDLDLSLSARFDEHSQFGGNTTGRAALAWRAGPDTLVRASVATGFRAPSLNEMFGPFGANANLQPEQSRSLELGVEHDFGRVQLGGAVFLTEIDDLISYVGAGYTQIAGTTTTEGFEVTGEVALTDALSFFGNYSYTDARNQTNARLSRVPRHDATLGLNGTWQNGWSGQITLNHVSDIFDGTVEMPTYTVTGLSVAREVNDAAELYLRVDNVFDEEYQTTRGYGASDRALYFGIRGSF